MNVQALEPASQGSGGNTVPGSVKTCGCENMWTWYLGIWFSGEPGGSGITIGLSGL